MADDSVTSKAIVASDVNGAQKVAEKIAKKEGIKGELSLDEKPDMSGGKYYSATWKKES